MESIWLLTSDAASGVLKKKQIRVLSFIKPSEITEESITNLNINQQFNIL